MPSPAKKELFEKYTAILTENPDFILTRYRGLNVEKISGLRKKLHEKGIKYAVIKNNVFKLALKTNKEIKEFPFDSTFTGPLGVAFVKSDLPVAAKILKEFGKENDKFEIAAGVMENLYYDGKGIERIADLPSREAILGQVAGMLNAPATKMAGVVNNIMASLARAIKAAGEKNG